MNMNTSPDSTPPYVRWLAPMIRPFPDFDFGFIKPVRARAAGLLHLRTGDRVIDAGCGSGGSFPYLRERIGDAGQVVGVEISEDAAHNARRRIEKHGWRNVDVVTCAAQTAPLSGRFDGLLMFAAPDVYASAPAFWRMAASLEDGAWIVAFGARLTETMPGRLLNPLLRLALAKLSPSTPPLTHEPWSLLARCTDEFAVEHCFGGSMFLASGRLRRAALRTPGGEASHGP